MERICLFHTLYSNLLKRMFGIATITLFLVLLYTFKISAKESYSLQTNSSLDYFDTGPGIVLDDIERSVSGNVTDTWGQPLPGVTVAVKGTAIGAVTNADGDYMMPHVPENATLIFSFVGMRTLEVLVGNQIQINVVLEEDVIGLEEVTAIGYGTQKKTDLTGAVSSISSGDIQLQPVERWDQTIQGKASGVMIRTSNFKPGASQSIRIRGINSIHGSNDPLVVIDGIIGADLNSIDANSIERIDILKDAAAASIYGSRGANGVILVTSKTGKPGKPSLSFDTSYGFTEPANFIEMMNAKEYMEFVNDARQRNGNPPVYNDINTIVNQIGDGTRWWDETFTTGTRQKYDLVYSGGTENTTYMASVGYLKNKGILKNVDYSRLNTRLNISAQVNSRIKLTNSISYSKTINNGMHDTNWTGNEPAVAAIMFRPVTSPKDEEGNYYPGLVPDPFSNHQLRQHSNVLYNLEREINESLGDYLQLSFSGEYKLLDVLKYNFQGSMDQSKSEYRFFRPSDVVRFESGKFINFPYASKNNSSNNQWLVENLLTFDQTFNDIHNVTAIAGTSAQKWVYETTGANARDFPFDTYEFHNLGSGESATRGVDSNHSQEQLLSFFGRINYDFNQRILIQLNARNDGSSKFAPGNKWGFFPSAALGWRISEENFIKELNIFDNAKFRVSYGSIGSHGINRYATLQRIGNESYGYGFHQTPVGVTQPIGIANKNLKWETTTQLNVGLDLGFFNNRLSFVLDYYHKTTTDLLLNKNISIVNYPYRNHEPSILSNIGSLENKGFEFMAGYHGHINHDFRYSLNINGTFQNTILTDLALAEGTEFLLYGDNLRRNYQILKEGEKYGNYVGYETNGLYQTQAEIDGSAQPNAQPGDLKYIDQNTDGIISGDDFKILGNAVPNFFGGFQGSFTYKNIDFSFFFFSMMGHHIFNWDMYNWKYGLQTIEYNKAKEVATHRWTGPETSNDIPRAGYQPVNVSDGPNGAIDIMVEDASFLRLKNVTLTYNLPQNLIKKFLGIERAGIYIQGENLLTFTGYSGVDPEIDQMGSSTTLLPMNTTYYPTTKTYVLGLSLGF
ncbi:MAG: TonB-dependent receptor [Parabacteroides sp.]|nr:TonB-dependent receptor [Parabacteroides sp.]